MARAGAEGLFGAELWAGGGACCCGRVNFEKMSKQHLTSFKVRNFKRFDSLELTDIGQFNLIVGDNNVGKTSLLEAISVLSIYNDNYPFDSLLQNLYHVLIRRGVDVKSDVDFFFKYLRREKRKPTSFDFSINQEHEYIDFKKYDETQITIERQKGRRKVEKVEKVQSQFPYLRLGGGQKNPSLIPANIEINGKLHEDYQSVLNHSISNKRLIIKNLKVIDNHIIEIEVLPIMEQSHVMIGFENSDLYMPITSMGESTVRAFYYLLQIIRNRGQRLMIDEIDTGIHYSRMKGFLKNIIQLADKNEVQLFMTTHSLECQEAFAEVFAEPDMVQHQAKARQFTLIETTDGQVEAVKRDIEQLEFALETHNETRGGKWPW